MHLAALCADGEASMQSGLGMSARLQAGLVKTTVGPTQRVKRSL